MILVPALAVVQIMKLRAETEAMNAGSAKVRREMKFQCRENIETCELFMSRPLNPLGCDKILEHGQFCLYYRSVFCVSNYRDCFINEHLLASQNVQNYIQTSVESCKSDGRDEL
jgi:hypothetical protein